MLYSIFVHSIDFFVTRECRNVFLSPTYVYVLRSLIEETRAVHVLRARDHFRNAFDEEIHWHDEIVLTQDS